ncbi:MAG: leucine--tRNA ligase [archaeon]
MDFKKIEKKWQKRWDEKKAFVVKESSKKKKCYVLEMYPYPSASYLHMGHVRNYTMGDVYARFKRMRGFNVLYPMGYDSFGLPAETAAKKEGIHPKKYAEDSIKKITGYFKSLGNSYDWSRTIASHDPDYYRWNQYFFLKLFEKGLAYRKKAPVNWCDSCESVLANEEAEGGKCWRCGGKIVVKHLEQWFFKITDYADRLLKDLDKIDWPERIKTMQKNWIGKSQGVEIEFDIHGKKWPVFTTRPDTLFGVTFMVISAQHPYLTDFVTEKQSKNVHKFTRDLSHANKEDFGELDKRGVFTGSYAVNPMTDEKIPIYAGNFVVADYGSGMVMAVPAHDQRDFEFAKKYDLKIKEVIKSKRGIDEKAYGGSGKLINSGKFDGLDNETAKEEIMKVLEEKKLGKKTINYKIRDWLISRQRYWGTPIPVVYCDKCGVRGVSEKELPVKLPEKVDFKSKSNPLTASKSFLDAKCPKCKGKARRETDTMGGFVDSSWYFLRYCDSKNKKKPFDSKKTDYWMPVDQYVGGSEHAVMHLIYARFFVKALKDLGFVKFDEPFQKLFNQGIVYKDGAKMSKSKGNVVYQTDISDKYGIDTARLFLMFVSSPDKQMEWSDSGVEGGYRMVNRLIRLKEKVVSKSSAKEDSKINSTIKKVTENVESFDYPKAIINLSGAVDKSSESISKKNYGSLLKMFSVFCPHVAEELWSKIGRKGFASLSDWPVCDEKKIDEKFEKEEEAIDKTVSDVTNILKIVEGDKVYVYVLPNELEFYDAKEIGKRVGKEVIVFAVNDKKKYDPEGRSKKVKPGRAGIFVE